MSRPRRTGAVLLAVVATAAFGACGSGSSAARGRSSGDRVAIDGTGSGTAVRSQATAYARCMRDHGIDFPDPTFDGEGRPRFPSSGAVASGAAAGGRVDAAREACESTWPGMEGRYPRSPEELARLRTALLAFASCMRDHGVGFPDPTFDRDGRPQLQRDAAASDHSPGDDPAFVAAARACRDQLGDRPVMGSANSP